MFKWFNDWMATRNMTSRTPKFWDNRVPNTLKIDFHKDVDFDIEKGSNVEVYIDGQIVVDELFHHPLHINRLHMISGDMEGRPVWGITMAHDE